jgi:hypothetical protein
MSYNSALQNRNLLRIPSNTSTETDCEGHVRGRGEGTNEEGPLENLSAMRRRGATREGRELPGMVGDHTRGGRGGDDIGTGAALLMMIII